MSIDNQRQAEKLAAQAKPLLDKVIKIANNGTQKQWNRLADLNAAITELYKQCPESHKDCFEYLLTDWGTQARRDFATGYLVAMRDKLN